MDDSDVATIIFIILVIFAFIFMFVEPVDNDVDVKNSSDDMGISHESPKSHFMMPISTGSGTNYMLV